MDSNEFFRSPFDTCSLVIGVRGGFGVALLQSALNKAVLACKGVRMVSANP